MVATVADDVTVMYAGHAVEQASVDEIFAAPAHPYTRALLRSMPRLAAGDATSDKATGGRLDVIPGRPPRPGEVPVGCPFHPRCDAVLDVCRTTPPPLVELPGGRTSLCHVATEVLDGGPWLSQRAAACVAGNAMNGEPILEVRDLAKVFPVRRGVVLRRTVGQVQAVDGVSFTLRRGRTLGLVGESGSGKSTLARMLVGVERPTRGEVLVDGVDVTTMSRAARRELRRRVQMVFQDPYTSLNPRMSVGEIVGEPFRIHPDAVPAGGRDRAVKELLELVGLDPAHVHRYPHQFSGGQRQRIGIARALAVKPQVLVCDEPVSALDVSVQGQVINLLEDLQDELGLSYLFIAHDLAVVRHIADEVAVMYLGRIVEHGTAAAVYDDATHPYTQSADVGRTGARPDAPAWPARRSCSRATSPRRPTRRRAAASTRGAGSPPSWQPAGEPAADGVPRPVLRPSRPRSPTPSVRRPPRRLPLRRAHRAHRRRELDA